MEDKGRSERGSRETSIPNASFWASLRFNAFQILPNFVQGLFSRKPTRVAFFSRFDAEGRTVRLVEELKRKHGGLVWLPVFASKSLLVLDREAIAQVLDRSPLVYADPNFKRKGMSHFQPDALTLSRGEEWVDRRRFTESVLNTGKDAHRHAASFLEVIHTEVAGALAATEYTLTWESFETLFTLISRQILFGRRARSENQLTRCLQAMMRESNRVFALGKSKHFDSLYEALESHLRQPAADSLVAVASRTPSTDRTKVAGQLPHWMFALNDTLAANTARALALIAAHPAVERSLRAELREVDLTDPQAIARLPLLEGCLQEAMRIWPTTPLLSREALTDDVLAGNPVPAGTQILILNLFNHRDRKTFPYADRFAPEIWQEAGTRSLFHHFSGGPQVCPGMDLAVFVGKAVLAGLLKEYHYVLQDPLLPRPAEQQTLPYAFDYFKLRFRAERAEPSFILDKSALADPMAFGETTSDTDPNDP